MAALACTAGASADVGKDADGPSDVSAATCVDQAVILPDQAECLRRYRLEPGGEIEPTLAALYERGVELQKKNEFAAAAAVLDCAESAAGANPRGAIEYELLRRRGVLDYRRECPAQALEKFKQALKLAERSEDRTAQSKTWSNIGSALRRLGDYRGALQAQVTSLELQRGQPQAEAGVTLNNIADIYRDLGEQANAIRHYDQARAEFLRGGNRAEAAHVLSTLGVLALDGGDLKRGEGLLMQGRDELIQAGDDKYLMRTYGELGRAAIERGDFATAKRWTDSGLAIAARDPATIAPAPLQLQAARGDRLRGQPREAQQRISEALKKLAPSDSDRPALLAELANDFEALGEWPRAMAALRESEAATRQLREARYDRDMKWMQLRFETAERDRTIAALATENQVRALSLKQRTLALWLTVVSALAALLGLTVFFLRRQHRVRLAEAARRAKLAEEVDYYRRAAADLGIDRARLQAALDSREDAVLVLDVGGQVLAANRSAGELLQPSTSALAGRAFGELLDASGAQRFAEALEHLDESSAPQRFDFRLQAQPEALSAQLSESGHGEGLIVLGLKPSAAGTTHDAAYSEPLSVEAPVLADEELRVSFRRALVELMLAVVEAWERSTGQGRLELAEKSRIWRVTVDDGRLRARAMERYLSLSKLPRQPRWRDVLRSGYYVLAECTLEEPVRGELQRHVDAVLTYTRRHALV